MKVPATMHPGIHIEGYRYGAPRGQIPWSFFGPQYAQIYDLLMADVPYESWVDYLLDVARLHSDRPATIIDLACGTGTFALFAAQCGLSVYGIEGSQAMMEIFRRKAAASPYGESCTVSRSQLPKLPKLTFRFDAAVCFFDSLNYLVSPRAVANTIAGVSSLLRSGGVFVFDVNTDQAYRSGAFQAPPEIRLHDGTALHVSAECRYDDTSGRSLLELEFLDVATDTVCVRERHEQQFYPTERLAAWLKEAGFVLAACYRGFTLESASESDDRWTFIAVKVA